MNSTFRKFEGFIMTTQRVTSRCVEICIDVCDNHYLAELQVDGMIREKLEFQGQLKLTN